jgi:striatin 1/3/4
MNLQPQSAMNNGPAQGPEHGGPAGTEYTLQGTPCLFFRAQNITVLTNGIPGVMRFLQIEWHNHERLRNAWDIEREEMKQKIAKQEGANKKLRRVNEILEKHIRILERALKEERSKTKALTSGETAAAEDEPLKDAKGANAVKLEAKSGMAAMKRTSIFYIPEKLIC